MPDYFDPAIRKDVVHVKIQLTLTIRFRVWRLTLTISK